MGRDDVGPAGVGCLLAVGPPAADDHCIAARPVRGLSPATPAVGRTKTARDLAGAPAGARVLAGRGWLLAVCGLAAGPRAAYRALGLPCLPGARQHRSPGDDGA